MTPVLRDRRDNNLNFVRLLFAFFVLYSHSIALVLIDQAAPAAKPLHPPMTIGDIGVNGFFVVSGYLIFQSWENSRSARDFMKSRVLRIYPAFIVATLICLLIVGPLAAATADYWGQFKYWGSIRRLVLLRIPVTPAVFEGSPHPVVNGSMWSIGYEFGCYLAVLGLGLVPGLRRRLWVPALAAVMAVVYMAYKAIEVPLPWQEALATPPQTIRFGMFFFVGGSFYYLRDKVRFSLPLALAAAVLMVAAFLSPITNGVGLAVFGGYVVLYFAQANIPPLRPFARSIPDISYGVYLYAWPIQKLLIWSIPGITAMEVLAIASLLAIVAGTMSWYWVEKPCLNLKKRAPAPVPAPA